MLKTFSEALGLRRNDQLNPKLWDGSRLRPEVRTALLNFGEAWRKYAGIPESEVKDVIMVGGNAGYYYNDASDIDVHLLVDRSRLGMGPIVDEHLKDRKTLWSIRHDVRVKGYQVEPYAQDISERPPAGQGVYSLMNDRWLNQPVHDGYDPETDLRVARKVSHWQRMIDRLVGDAHGLDEFDAMKNKMADMRSKGIARGGELDPDNLVFKALRISGHLDKMSDYVKNKQVADLSI